MSSRREDLIQEENRRIRRLRVLVDLTRNVIYQDASLGHSDARQMVIDLRKVASSLFPGKEHTFDLVLWPRFDRILKERFGKGMDSTVH